MAKKLTLEQEVAVWRARIVRGTQDRDKIKADVWDRNQQSLEGKLKPAHNVWAPTDPWISIEMVASAVRAAIPSLLYSNPKWKLTPKKVALDENGVDVSWERARLQELWLDEVWRESEGNKHVRVAILAAFANIGAINFGYSPDFADDEKRGEFEYTEDGELQQTGDQDGLPLYKLKKGEYMRNMDRKDKKNFGKVYHDDEGMPMLHPGTLQKEAFFVDWVPAENMIFDPEGGNVFSKHRWFVLESFVPLDEVKNDPRFTRSVRERIVATGRVGDDRKENREMGGYAQGANPPAGTTDPVMGVMNDEARVKIFDIFDFVDNEWLVLADSVTSGSGDKSNEFFLLRKPVPAGYEKGPTRFLRFNEILGQFYPKTDIEGMAKLELEYNITRSQMLTHRNQSRTRYLETKNAGFGGDDGADVERQKFANGPSGVIIQVKDPSGIQPLRKDTLDGSFFQAVPNIRLDFNDISGIAGDTTLASVDTATQASLLSSSADVKNNDRRDNQVQVLLGEIGAGLLRVGQANSLKTRYVKVGTPNGPEAFQFKPVSPADLQGDFDVSVTMGSTQPMNSSARVALYEKIILLISQNPIIGASPTLMKRMFESIDLRDENLIAEIEAIGKKAMEALGGQQDNQAATTQDQQGGAAAGTSTGAPTN